VCWLRIVPLAAALCTLAPRHAADAALQPPAIQGLVAAAGPALFIVWLTGAALAVAYVGWVQLAFLREARRGRAGPAVVGLICPRIVMPAHTTLTADERKLARLHEQEHIARRDPALRALITLVQCLSWFNPLVHVAAGAARMDQELACDAAVVRRIPGRKRAYAEALLKSQAGAAAWIGCQWRAPGRHPLEVRVAALGALSTTRADHGWSVIIAGLAATAAGVMAWLAQPATPPDPPFIWPSQPVVVAIVYLHPTQAQPAT
jgi:hypothetical protein